MKPLGYGIIGLSALIYANSTSAFEFKLQDAKLLEVPGKLELMLQREHFRDGDLQSVSIQRSYHDKSVVHETFSPSTLPSMPLINYSRQVKNG